MTESAVRRAEPEASDLPAPRGVLAQVSLWTAIKWRVVTPFFFKSIAQGAATTLVACQADLSTAKAGGAYFNNGAATSVAAKMPEQAAARLWRSSERLVQPWLAPAAAAEEKQEEQEEDETEAELELELELSLTAADPRRLDQRESFPRFVPLDGACVCFNLGPQHPLAFALGGTYAELDAQTPACPLNPHWRDGLPMFTTQTGLARVRAFVAELRLDPLFRDARLFYSPAKQRRWGTMQGPAPAEQSGASTAWQHNSVENILARRGTGAGAHDDVSPAPPALRCPGHCPGARHDTNIILLS